LRYRPSFGKQDQSRLRILISSMPVSRKGKPVSSKPHNLQKRMTSSWAWTITFCTCLLCNVLVILILAYRQHGLLEEVGEYDGAAIKNALYELGVGYSGASGTTTWDENGDRFSATYGIR
jgi:hypothetical protein